METTSGTQSNEIPSQLRPVPQILSEIASDEESFVVLGQSLDCDISLPVSYTSTTRNSIVESAQRNTDESLEKLTKALPLMPPVENHFEQTVHTNIDNISLSADWSPEEIQQKISTLLEENQQLKKTILQNNISMKSHYQRIVAWQDDVQKTYSDHKEKFEEAKKFINTLKLEIFELNNALKKKDQDINDLQNSVKATEKAVIDKEKMLNDKLTGLEKTVCALQHKNDILETENMRSRFSEHTVTAKNDQEELCLNAPYLGNTESCQKLKHELVAMGEELERTKHQLMLAQQKITTVEYARNVANAQLAGKSDEVVSLKRLLESFKYTEDDMFALKEQLAVYKADFDTETNTKEIIRGEKNQLAEDMHNLQVRNQKLQEEIELLRNRGGNYFPERRSSLSSSLSSAEYKYSCPKCLFAFSTYEALENHVHRCLDITDTLP